MRTFICLAILALAWSSTAFAQIKINETIATKANQEIYFDLNHPDVIFKTWDRNEVQIKGTVSVNNGQNDDAFSLSVDKEGRGIYIEAKLENECKLPRMISGVKDGKRVYLGTTKKGFSWDAESFKNKYGDDLNNINIGVLVEAKFEVMIPKNIALKVETRFGDIVINDFYNSINAESTHGSIDVVFDRTPDQPVNLASTHGHVDVSIPKTSKVDMELKTSHGEILTDLDLDFGKSNGHGGKNHRRSCNSSRNTIEATMNGGGIAMELRSTHNKVYLRELK